MREYKYKNKRNKRLSIYRDLKREKREKRKDFVVDLVWASVLVLYICFVILIMTKG